MANLNIPADLTFTGFPDPSDKNYFDVTVKGLNPDTHYGIQFQWLFADGTKSDWSATRDVLSSLITTPGQPDLGVNDVVGGPGYIKVTWSGTAGGSTATDVARVDVYISGAPFDGTKPADSFVASGTKTITAPAGTYIVKLKALRSDGTTSSLFSVTRTITVQGIGQVVETPTLPTGLSVTSIPFGTQVSWDGTYVSSTFKGFQSIVINASTTNVGASVTTEPGIPVAQLSVNNAKNSANIPLGANVGYAFDTFYYYIATNTDGTLYKENGVATWTRINSVGVRPTKANKIDLENGVISIENLVAGNGAFTTYLKAGADNGARVTLSGLTTTTNGVLPGLTIYKSDGTTPAMRADFSGNLSFSGDISGATGTLTNALNVGTAVGGKYPFSVSGSGVLNSTAGSIGGFTIDATSLQANNNTFQLDSTNGRLAVGPIGGSHIEIDGTSGILHKSSSSASGNFQLTSSGHLTLGSSSGSGNYLEWDGTNLNIRGGLTITGGPTYDAIADATSKSTAASGAVVTLTSTVSGHTGNLETLNTFYNNVDTLLSGNYTQIDGGRIKTGIIKSTGTVTINGVSQPVSQINLNTGQFIFGGGSLTLDTDTSTAALTFNAEHDQPFQIKAVSGTSLTATSSTYNWDGTTDSLGGTDANTTIRSADTSPVSLSATETIGIIQKNTSGSTGPRLLMSTGSGGFTEVGAYGSTYNSSIIFNNGHIIFKSNLSSPYVMQGLGSTTHPSYSYTDIPTTLNINAQGTLSRGRAIFRSGNTEAKILTGNYTQNGNDGSGYSWIGVSGDIIFSTSD